MEVSTIWGMIDSRCIVFPARSSGLNALTLLFRTPVEQARPFLGGGAFEFVRSDADTVDVYVSFHDFTSGDWGRTPSQPARGAGAGSGARRSQKPENFDDLDDEIPI